MPLKRIDPGLDRTTVGVWLALLVVGLATWEASGTPVAGAAVVFSVVLAFTSPSGALYATCAAIPLVFHPVGVGSLSVGLLEIGILTTALGTAFRLGYDWVMERSAPPVAVLHPIGLLVVPIGLVLIGTISLVWMPFDLHRAEALRTWRWVIIEPVLLFGLARLAIARDGRAPLAFAISIPATIVAADALWQFVHSSSSFSVDDVHRSTSTYLHPNNLALYLERALFLILLPGFFARGPMRWVLLGCAGIIAGGLAVTFSRGSLLALGAGFAVFLLAQPVRQGWRILAVGLALVSVAFGVFATQRFTGSTSSGILSTRRYLWLDSLHMLRDFPISGIGLDQFLWLHQQRYIDPRIWSERYLSHPHNLLLDTWLSLGILGVVLLGTSLFAGAWVVVAARYGRLRLDSWQLGALACLGAGLGHGLVDNGYFLADLAALTWLSIALVASSERNNRPLTSASPNG
jgi:putative inorganic carbon (HCO3(-)) transporter